MHENLLNEVLEYNKSHLNEKRIKHVKGVIKTAKELAELYGEDPEKAELAAAFHDMFRWLKDEKLESYVGLLRLDKKYAYHPNLAHSKIAACIMERDYDIKDKDLINAVSYHTTGRANMSKLEKIIYLADAIEPNRDYPNVKTMRDLAKHDLDLACLESMKSTIDFLNRQDKPIDSDTLAAVEYFERLKEKT